MHVADVTMFYAPRSGGVRRYIDAKRAWLAARPGFSHTLVVPAVPDAPVEAGVAALPSVPLPRSHGYRVPLSGAAAVRVLIARRPTLIESGDPYHLAWAALRAASKLRVPSVAFCHSDLPGVAGAQFGRRAERVVARYYAALYRHFDLVLAPSRAMTGRLHAWGIGRARHQPLGVDLETFHPDRSERALRQRIGLPQGARIVVYAGRFAPEKNLDVVVDAVRQLGRDYVALLVGAGRAPRVLPPNVRIVPYIPGRAELASLLAACDVFVHAGDKETFGLGVLEALACGVPVVGADAAGVAEIVTPEAGLLVRARDASAFAQGVVALLERDVEALRINARRRAEAFGWERILPQIVARYEALAARTCEGAAITAPSALTDTSRAVPARIR